MRIARQRVAVGFWSWHGACGRGKWGTRLARHRWCSRRPNPFSRSRHENITSCGLPVYSASANGPMRDRTPPTPQPGADSVDDHGSGRVPPDGVIYRFELYELDKARREIRRSGDVLDCPPKVYEL